MIKSIEVNKGFLSLNGQFAQLQLKGLKNKKCSFNMRISFVLYIGDQDKNIEILCNESLPNTRFEQQKSNNT